MIRKISNILIALILATVIGLLLILGIPLVRGQKLYVVQTGSMLPVYPINSVVVVQPMAPDGIQVGDDITFEGLSDGTLVTHRVLEDHPEDRQFITKGTNNRVEDLYPTEYDSLIGKVVYNIPYIGILAATLQSTSGKIIAGCFLIFVMILLILPELFEPTEEDSDNLQEEKTPPIESGKKETRKERRAQKKALKNQNKEKQRELKKDSKTDRTNTKNNEDVIDEKLPQRESPAAAYAEFEESPRVVEPPKEVYKAPVPQINTGDENSPFDDFPPFLQDEDIHHE